MVVRWDSTSLMVLHQTSDRSHMTAPDTGLQQLIPVHHTYSGRTILNKHGTHALSPFLLPRFIVLPMEMVYGWPLVCRIQSSYVLPTV